MCKSWNSILWYSLVIGFAIDDGLHYVWLKVLVFSYWSPFIYCQFANSNPVGESMFVIVRNLRLRRADILYIGELT